MTDRGTEYCSKAEQHDDPLYLALNDSENTKTKVKSPQTHGIGERFHKTVKDEFYMIALRKTIYDKLEDLQNDLDHWLTKYTTQRTHQGKMCCGRTPMETLIDRKRIWMEKCVNQTSTDRHHKKRVTVRSGPNFYNLGDHDFLVVDVIALTLIDPLNHGQSADFRQDPGRKTLKRFSMVSPNHKRVTEL